MEMSLNRIDIIEGYNSRVLDDWENAMARGYAGGVKNLYQQDPTHIPPLNWAGLYVRMEPFTDPKGLLKALPYAAVHYNHMHPMIHTLTRFVVTCKKMGILQNPRDHDIMESTPHCPELCMEK